MKRLLTLIAFAGVINASLQSQAVTLIGGSLNNGDLDATISTEITPGFFLPKPTVWENIGSRLISGPYEGEMSSEPWAGPAPTPVTTNGSGLASPNGCDGLDCGVFFKAFSGDAANGPVTAHLQQDFTAITGWTYTFSGWAGVEPNFSGNPEFAIEFINSQNGLVTSETINLVNAGLYAPNGQPFSYKKYTVSAVAPPTAVTVRARVSMMNGRPNPLGGGQAFVVDDFTFIGVPEPAAAVLGLVGALSCFGLVRRR